MLRTSVVKSKFTAVRGSARLFSTSFALRSVAQWNEIPMAPPDKILGITEKFIKDSNSKKINLGVGAYRDNEGKPLILPSVKEVEKTLSSTETNKEYAPILGSANFRSLVQKFIFNNDSNGNKLINEKKIVTSQTISGTGSLRIIAEFLARFHKSKKIYVPNPTWANHLAIFKDVDIEPVFYDYYDASIKNISVANLKASLLTAEEGSSILLHPCCHNPTGLDIPVEEWDSILEIILSRNLYPVVDMAYQGFASGDPLKDVYVIAKLNKLVVDGKLDGYSLCQSFAKNMGLYGERTGSLSLVNADAQQVLQIESQLKKLIRPIYSSPPIHGSKIVEAILSNEEIYYQWLTDVKMIVDRMITIRKTLYNNLDKTNYNWDHLLIQNGMFCYTGLSKEHIIELREKYSVYATEDGRFSISGVNDGNVKYLANAINEVVNKFA